MSDVFCRSILAACGEWLGGRGWCVGHQLIRPHCAHLCEGRFCCRRLGSILIRKHFSFKSAVRVTAVPSLPLVSVTVGCAQVPSVTGSIWWGSHYNILWVVSTQPFSPCTFWSSLVMLMNLLLPLFAGRSLDRETKGICPLTLHCQQPNFQEIVSLDHTLLFANPGIEPIHLSPPYVR